MRRTILGALAGLPLTSRGDGLRRPLNAPSPQQTPVGVQPGTTPGTVFANRVIIAGPKGGLFVYSGQPAAGNLVESAGIAPGATVDPTGRNAILPGDTNYNYTVGHTQVLALQKTGGAINAWVATTQAGPYTQVSTINFDTAGNVNIPGILKLAAGVVFIPSTGGNDGPTITSFLASGYEVLLAPAVYNTNVPITYPQGAVIRGIAPSGFGLDTQTTIKATAAMSAVLASAGWATGANTAAQTAVTITDLNVDGASLATHGIVTQNYDSNFDRLNVQNVSGDGLRMDAFSSSGLVQITTSGVANRVTRCTFQNVGRGLATNEASSGAAVYTDGFATDNLVATASGAGGMTIQRAAGWKICGNHLYGLTQNGIQVGQCFATSICDNYIETWGTNAAAAFYGAIDGFTIGQSDGGPASVITGNRLMMFANAGNVGSTILGVGLNCLAANKMNFSVTGNVAWCGAAAASFLAADAFRYANIAASSTTTIATTGNLAPGNWTAGILQVPNGGVMTVNAGI